MYLIFYSLSPPSRGRGLKRSSVATYLHLSRVAPFTGAWVETLQRFSKSTGQKVAPFTGAWVETSKAWWITSIAFVAPFTGAWVETA